MKKIFSFVLIVLSVIAISFSIANFTSVELGAWQHKGTYGEIIGHGWACGGEPTNCVVGGPDAIVR